MASSEEGATAPAAPVQHRATLLLLLRPAMLSSTEPCRPRCALSAAPPPRQVEYSAQKKLHILDRLAWSEMFESFLANKYTAAKRWAGAVGFVCF